MNGTRLLVLISFLSQICLVSHQAPAQTPQASAGERDYGWQISPEDGVLEYIVQLSPETVALMQATNQENASDMPPQLVGRATRTVVRIGTAILPRSPSLEEIGRKPRFNTTADLNAALDQGRFSDLESDAVVNVQSGVGLPPLPGGLSRAADSLTDRQGNLIDNAARAASDLQGGSQTAAPGQSGAGQSGAGQSSVGQSSVGQSSVGQAGGQTGAGLGSQFLNSAAGAMPPGRNDFASDLPRSGFPGTGLPGTGANDTGKFKETAPSTLPRAGAGNPNSGLNGAAEDPLGTQNWQGTRTADNRGLPGFSSNANTAGGQWSGNANDPMSLNYDGRTGDPRASTGFGQPPGGQIPGRSLADAIGQSGNYYNPNMNAPNTGYPNGLNTNYPIANSGNGYPQQTPAYPNGTTQPGNFAGGGPGGVGSNLAGNVGGVGNAGGTNGGFERIASNPNVQNNGSQNAGLNNSERTEASSSDSNTAGAGGKPSRASDNFIQVFFLLSLVVNFYLAMLIRKLLARYRSLLSSVRSSTA